VAAILGAAIGKPDLKWETISEEQTRNNLIAIGMAPQIAAGLAEMQTSMHSGEFCKIVHFVFPNAAGLLR